MIAGFFIGLAIGIIAGLALAFIFKMMRVKSAKELTEELYQKNEAERLAATSTLIENLKASFGSISLASLSQANEQLLTLAKSRLETITQAGTQDLDSKKGLIDQQLKSMTVQLENVSKLMKELENDREKKFGELANELKNVNEKALNLTQTTDALRGALAGSQSRGRLGELVAERILESANLVEHIHYEKQKTIDGEGSRPDFTFILPNKIKLNMDIKFPWDNYEKYLNAESESDKTICCNEFLQNVRARVKEISTRPEYINRETIDYVLLLIPSEQVYAFIWMQDKSIIEDGLKNKVICCSPITFSAVLAVITQAVDTFRMERKSGEILSLISDFDKQWTQFVKRFDDLGKQIEKTRETYEQLTGTRRRQLDRVIEKIDDLREERGIEAAQVEKLAQDTPQDEKDA